MEETFFYKSNFNLFHSRFQIPAPANWQDFEDLCTALWREIWEDPNTQKNGRQGQVQYGVDIIGQPGRGEKWAGVQCKLKDNSTGKSLTEEEVKIEIESAKHFSPKLSEFIIATTAVKDAKIESFARKVTIEHQNQGLFSVHIFGWEDIVSRLDILKKHEQEEELFTYGYLLKTIVANYYLNYYYKYNRS